MRLQHEVSEESLQLSTQTLVAEASKTGPRSHSTLLPAPPSRPPPPIPPRPQLPHPYPHVDYPQATVLEQSNCRYGPGEAYLYEWGLYADDRVTVTARNDLGTWVYVQPRSYSGSCWVKTSLLQIDGEIEPLPPYYGRLPYSDLYKTPTNPKAVREGDQVIITWDAGWRTTDDDRGYLIEAWLCQDGQLLFTPLNTPDYTSASLTVTDEYGCMMPSGARLYTAEKHGYTEWVKINWPQAEPGD